MTSPGWLQVEFNPTDNPLTISVFIGSIMGDETNSSVVSYPQSRFVRLQEVDWFAWALVVIPQNACVTVKRLPQWPYPATNRGCRALPYWFGPTFHGPITWDGDGGTLYEILWG